MVSFLRLLLSTVTDDSTQERTDRVTLLPWVKFLWEAYRTVLDMLRNNAKVETLYQETAQRGNTLILYRIIYSTSFKNQKYYEAIAALVHDLFYIPVALFNC